MNTEQNYYIGITGYAIPYGEINEPLGKEGILAILREAYEYGTTKYPSSEELFVELEKLGASLTAWSDPELSGIAISAPVDRLDEAQKLLDHIVEEVHTTDTDLKTIKDNQLMEIKAARSNDITLALATFLEAANGQRWAIGTPESVNSITAEDVRKLQEMFNENKKPFKITGEKSFELPDTLAAHEEPILTQQSKKRLDIIKKDLEQKVLFLGYPTDGYEKYPLAVVMVGHCVMHRGLGGMLPHKIRHQNSAAYYAAYTHLRYETFGAATGYAGTTEKTLLKAVELMLESFASAKSELISDEEFANSISYAKGRATRSYEGLGDIVVRDLARVRYGLEPLPYEQLMKEIENVTKEDILNYFKDVVGDKTPHIIINGKISEETESKLRELLNVK